MVKVGACMKNALPYLIVLYETIKDVNLRKKLLLKNKFILPALRELCVNLLKENIILHPVSKKKLRKFRKELPILAKRGSNNSKTKILLNQKGKSAALLSTLLSIGIPLITKLISNGSSN